MRVALLLPLLLASSASAQDVPATKGPITCSSPVAPNDSAKSLMQRYGQEAKVHDDLFTGIEDITYKGVVLLPHASDWRIEVSFTDEEMNRVGRLTVRDTKTSYWSVGGVTIGSTLAEVQKANGKPFFVNGFDTDFAGFVMNWNGGTFRCRVAARCPYASKRMKIHPSQLWLRRCLPTMRPSSNGRRLSRKST